MKDDVLESLLLDHALGALSPEVAALLEAHLALNPAASRRAAEIAETVQLARAAVATPLEPPRRKLDVERLRQARQHAWPATRRTELLRLAACLLLGLGVGWSLRTLPSAAGPASPPIAATSVGAVLLEPSVHFWSVARYAPNATTLENSRRLRWSSPVTVPPNTSIQ